MKINNVTVLIPSWNEERNIYKCLRLLKNFNSVIVLDSKSNDRTRIIVSRFRNAKLILTSLKDYVSKLNFLISLSETKWVLFLDADYEISKNLIFFLKNKKLINSITGYSFPIYNVINDIIICEKIYPSKILLVNKTKIYFKRDGHKENIITTGKIKHINYPFLHNDKKDKKRWMETQIKWATYDAKKILKTKFTELRLIDQFRIFPFFSTFVAIIYYLFYKRIYKYGKAGFLYLLQRLIYESTVNIMVIKSMFNKITNKKNKL